MIIAIIIAIVAYLVLYVFNKPNNKLKEQIITMEGMKINLTFNNIESCINGIDSLYESTKVKKLIIYVDSTSCTDCFLSHLVSYNEINDTLSAYNGETIVLLQPQKRKLGEVKDFLNYETYPFWCILDLDGEFISLNPKLPNNKILHTFLLNEDNDIVLIGDPTRNSRIKDLFHKTLKAL